MAPLADMIKQSAALAITRGQATGREEITRDLMEEVVLDYWSTLEYAERRAAQARKEHGGHPRETAGSRASRA
jgi:hypothetical protein